MTSPLLSNALQARMGTFNRSQQPIMQQPMPMPANGAMPVHGTAMPMLGGMQQPQMPVGQPMPQPMPVQGTAMPMNGQQGQVMNNLRNRMQMPQMRTY